MLKSVFWCFAAENVIASHLTHICKQGNCFYSPQWVEHCLAVGPAAQYWFVLDGWQVRPLLEWCEQAGDWDH